MSNSIIEVRNLSKKFIIGHEKGSNQRYTSLRDVISDKFKTLGKRNKNRSSMTEEFWALKNISFDVRPGDRIGIIGRNGAGKSTLLRVLSQITEPTEGTISIKGRVASLLEVGTGFHPELTGRENIFLNGAILGMSRAEMREKFDEIVDFAGTEKFLDTPVKRYSSGMYVRLAFAVAAHLEPETLVVDEVLAVGDAEFQKKCLGKMRDVSVNHGRTVLFVSHDMHSISTLTDNVIYLRNGMISFIGKTREGIDNYLSDFKSNDLIYQAAARENLPTVTRAELTTSAVNNVHESGKELRVKIEVFMPEGLERMACAIEIQDMNGRNIIHSRVFDHEQQILRKSGLNVLECVLPSVKLNMGKFKIAIHLAQFFNPLKFETIVDICPFEVVLYEKNRDHNWTEDSCVYFEESFWRTT
jgi:lipopolysaccharide transport system ATP-binding protein